jgi:exodeoxyribonuclease V alpha subunit
MVRLNGRLDPDLATAARAASAWSAAGHVCVPLQMLPDAGTDLSARLLATKVVGPPGAWRPLILDGAGRLYLQRFWQHEQRLTAAIRARVAAPQPLADADLLARGLDIFFGSPPNDQRAAAETALTSSFCVITGGPGSGKTRTVAGILAMLRAQFAAAGRELHVALAAPTGKAAARMTESIRQALQSLPDATPNPGDLKSAPDAVTLHRLLGITPASQIPRFDATHPLPYDAVIVDEASMIDLALMAKLFAATPRQARIILLGDKDQLASVEAGHVLGDICPPGDAHASSPLRRCIVELRRSYRFAPGSGIHQLSVAVNAGRADEALALLQSGTRDVASLTLPTPDALTRALRDRVVSGFREALTTAEPRLALAALDRFRILCAIRHGPFGVETINRLAEAALAGAGLISPSGSHYHGRPVIILRNDYTLRLSNGDIGMILRDPDAADALRAFLLAPDGALRRIVPARLPEHETVWAMTVHKSQGSEFDRVLLILPDRDYPVLTRELLYTAITRPRTSAEIWHREAVLRAAIARRTGRLSGLHDALWKTG